MWPYKASAYGPGVPPNEVTYAMVGLGLSQGHGHYPSPSPHLAYTPPRHGPSQSTPTRDGSYSLEMSPETSLTQSSGYTASLSPIHSRESSIETELTSNEIHERSNSLELAIGESGEKGNSLRQSMPVGKVQENINGRARAITSQVLLRDAKPHDTSKSGGLPRVSHTMLMRLRIR